MKKRVGSNIIKEKEIDPEKLSIFTKYFNINFVTRDSFECKKNATAEKIKILTEFKNEMNEKYGDFDDFIKENTKKYNISIVEALALYVRNCFDGSLLFCEHCLENRCTFHSFKHGWNKFCTTKCSYNNSIKSLRELTKEERLETLRVKKEHGFSSFEEARYFIEKKTIGLCKFCKKPTKFINYLKGYKARCEYCNGGPNKPKPKRDHVKNLGERIKTTIQKLHEYGDSCYEMLAKYQLSKLSQASWHLSRNDSNCLYGCCVNCGKRLVFHSYTVGYSNSCKCNVKKTVNIIKNRKNPPLSLQKKNEFIFLRDVFAIANAKNINDELTRKIKNRTHFKTEEKIKKAREDYIMFQVKKWGAEKIFNPIFLSAINKRILNFGEINTKEKLKEKGYDPNVYDLSNDPNWWYQIYVKDGMTIDEINYYTGLSKNMIKNRLKRFGLMKNDLDSSFDDENNEILDEEKDEYLDLLMPKLL